HWPLIFRSAERKSWSLHLDGRRRRPSRSSAALLLPDARAEAIGALPPAQLRAGLSPGNPSQQALERRRARLLLPRQQPGLPRVPLQRGDDVRPEQGAPVELGLAA